MRPGLPLKTRSVSIRVMMGTMMTDTFSMNSTLPGRWNRPVMEWKPPPSEFRNATTVNRTGIVRLAILNIRGNSMLVSMYIGVTRGTRDFTVPLNSAYLLM